MRRTTALHPALARAIPIIGLLGAIVLVVQASSGFFPVLARDNAPASGPELRSPSNGAVITDLTPTFMWSAAPGAALYRFELATDDTFSSPIAVNKANRRSFTLSVPLTHGLSYVWRVASLDENEDSTFSFLSWFSVEPLATATSTPAPTPTPVPIRHESTPPREAATERPRVIASALTGVLPATTGYALSGAGRSNGSITSTSIVDRNLATIWVSPSSKPSTAFVYVKLDRARDVGKIRWMLGKSGFADSMQIQISTDKRTWTTITTRTNSPAGEWREVKVNKKARYIRFYFTNPRGDAYLGGLTEVEVFPVALVAATQTPAATSSNTPSPTPPATATRTPRPTRTPVPTRTPLSSSTPTHSPSPTSTATQAPTDVPTQDPTETTVPTLTPTQTATASPTSTSTATPLPTVTPTPTPTPTVTPTATNTSTPTMTPTPAPAATATPVIPPVIGGLLNNPSFEFGEEDWYIEGQGQVVGVGAHGGQRAMRLEVGGGFTDQHLTMLPGNTYELSAWARLDGGVDIGYVGVTYRNAGGVRLIDLEPAPLTFIDTIFVFKEMNFTVPAGVAEVTVYAWKNEGPAALMVDDVYLIKSISDQPAAISTPVTSGCQRLIAPAYFYPTTGQWETMIDGGSALDFIVLNPNSGVANKHEWRYDAPLASARAAGIRIVGYIQTDYGLRSPEAVIAEMDRYREWYGVTSFFLDEGDTDPESLPLYQEMTDHAHMLGGITIINFGHDPHPAYMELTDYAVIFEDSMEVFNAYEPPAWVDDFPSDRFINFVYGAPADQVDDVIATTLARNVGRVWITDDHINTGSPYNMLPGYWAELNETMSESCA